MADAAMLDEKRISDKFILKLYFKNNEEVCTNKC
jgi:hypothetical protein